MGALDESLSWGQQVLGPPEGSVSGPSGGTVGVAEVARKVASSPSQTLIPERAAPEPSGAPVPPGSWPGLPVSADSHGGEGARAAVCGVGEERAKWERQSFNSLFWEDCPAL